MGTRSEALYNAVLADVMESSPLTPVGLSEIPPDASTTDFRCMTLLRTLLKKWVPRDATSADLVAKTKFLASNKSCKDWKFTPEFESDRVLFGEFQRELDQFFHPGGQVRLGSYEDILDKSRVGPGSAIDARGQSMYAKLFASPLTTTSEDLYLLYRLYISKRPRWLHAESLRYTQHGCPVVVGCSKTTFVPKTVDTSRMICVEPSLNMFMQLGLGRLMEEWLERSYGISMDTQPDINRRLARIGSIDNSIATIDLSSASDSISLNLCKRVLPGWLYAILSDLRSPSTLVDGVEVRLEMMSTMGNGFTFPLQTILFSSIIRAAHRIAGIPVYDGVKRNWSCFGDDLICDARASRLVLRLLKLTGFTPNSSKTFIEGPFRESCGTDWLSGQPVRGVYLKRLDSPQDLCVAINLLNEWSAISGVPLIQGVSLLRNWLGRNFLPTPYYEGMNSGVRVPFSYLKREHYRFDPNHSILYRRFESKPVSIRVTDTGLVTPRGIKKLTYNPEGLICSFIMGELRDGSYMVRHDHVRYRTKQVCTPYWDYARSDVPLDRGVASWQRWEIAVLINMSNP